jgi:Uma2 family endonuclease
MVSVTPQLTHDDLRAMPEDGQRYELLAGKLHVTPAPSTTHQRISRNLEFILHAYVTAHHLGEVLYAPVDVILHAGSIVQPDIVFVSAVRASIVTEQGVEGAPDLVIEILSPSTEARDRGEKRRLYAEHGVAHYWLVDGSTRTLTELALDGVQYGSPTCHSAVFASRLFPTLAIDLSVVFGGQ